MKVHRVKCLESHYKDVAKGIKPFEFRRNDRDYQVGDILILQRTSEKTYKILKGEIAVEVTYILHGRHGGLVGLPYGYCCMAIRDFSLDWALELEKSVESSR
jgi:hypothetical protein